MSADENITVFIPAFTGLYFTLIFGCIGRPISLLKGVCVTAVGAKARATMNIKIGRI
jgi:hypothetical protein